MPTAAALTDVLRDAGGSGAPHTALAALKEALGPVLQHGARELQLPRIGYEDPVCVLVGPLEGQDGLAALTPAPAAFRTDPSALSDRAWPLQAAVVGLLVDLLEPWHLATARDLALTAGEQDGALVVHLRGRAPDPQALDELLPLFAEERLARLDRVRARALAVPVGLIAPHELKPLLDATHPLNVAEVVTRLGGDPAVPAQVEEHEAALTALLGRPEDQPTAPHQDPDPARRVARRILQRLDGMGKWGGYHTDVAHLQRGFAPGNEQKLAADVGEALLRAGLLSEKPSVGQRHVFLNPRRAGAVHALIREGTVPDDLVLPRAH